MMNFSSVSVCNAAGEFSLVFLGSIIRLLVILTVGLMLFLENVGYRQGLSFSCEVLPFLLEKCESFSRWVFWILNVFCASSLTCESFGFMYSFGLFRVVKFDTSFTE